MSLAIGIDVGGTKIAGGVVDEDGTIVTELTVTSPAQDAEAVEEAIAGLVARLCRDCEVTRVGVGAAGYIDEKRARVMFAPNLAWHDLDLRAELEQRLGGLPVVVENDANAAAWGEFRYGAARDVQNLLLLTVGTGVGGGIVQDGRPDRGGFGVAAEVGHLRVVPGGRMCGCGNRGCLEPYASGSALVANVQADIREGSRRGQPLLERAGGDPERITGPMITAAAEEGDPFAVEHLAEVGRWLGEALASLTAVLDPAVTVLGGGVSRAGELLAGPVREHFTRHLTGRGHRPVQEIRLAELGNRAGLIGAADLSRQ